MPGTTQVTQEVQQLMRKAARVVAMVRVTVRTKPYITN